MPVDAQSPYLFIVALFGLLLGSFLNVCIYRVPRDLSVITPRSFCVECGKQIRSFDNIPLLSYALLRGKCRSCGKAIGIRYPIVELTTACLFVALAIEYCWTLSTLKWGIFEAILIVLFWTDLEERILPDELTLGGIVVGIVFAAFVPVTGAIADLLLPASAVVWRSFVNIGVAAIVLAGPIWLLAAVYARVRKREGLGLGDVKLLVLLAVFLGLEKGVLAVMIGAVAGSVIGVAYILVLRKQASTYELPFGSFLCAGAAIVPFVSK